MPSERNRKPTPASTVAPNLSASLSIPSLDPAQGPTPAVSADQADMLPVSPYDPVFSASTSAPYPLPNASSSYSSSVSPLIETSITHAPPASDPATPTPAGTSQASLSPAATQPVREGLPISPDPHSVVATAQRYLGPVIPEDAVMPTPPSPHSDYGSRPLSVFRMLQRNPPPLDLNLPVIRVDHSGPVHRPPRQKRPLYDVRKPTHAAVPQRQQQKPPMNDCAKDGARTIALMIAAAQKITDADIDAEDLRTRDDIKRRRKLEKWDSQKQLAAFQEFAERAVGPMTNFAEWAREEEPQVARQDSDQHPPAPLSGISKYAKRLFMMAHSDSFKV